MAGQAERLRENFQIHGGEGIETGDKINHGETFGGQGDNRSWRWDTVQPQHSSLEMNVVSQPARVLSS
jgi:hypothetical protein